jgi:hypothetical protein
MELQVLPKDPNVSTQNLSRLRVPDVQSKSNDGVIETVQDSSTMRDETGQATRSKKNSREYVQLSALYWSMFVLGWNDGSTGPLLPRIQEVYHVYAVSPLTFYCIQFLCRYHISLSLLFLCLDAW